MGMLCMMEQEEYDWELHAPMEDDIKLSPAEYRKMLIYAIVGCKDRIWKTAFDLNRPELNATQAHEIAFQIEQMATDLDGYEAEAERLGFDK